MSALAQHVGHRTSPLDDRRLRCLDCARTIVITQPSKSTSTSKSAIPEPGDPRCPRHEHEHADACRTCAADAKANPDADRDHGHRELVHQPTADVPARAAEARAALPPRAADPGPRTPPADPERMAAARAELDALRPAPADADEPAGSPT